MQRSSATLTHRAASRSQPAGRSHGDPYPDDTSLSSQTMPAPDTFPALYLPTTGWNIVTIPSSHVRRTSSTATRAARPLPTRPVPVRAREPDRKDGLRGTDVLGHLSNAQVFAQNAYPTGDAILDVASMTFSNSDTFCEESATDSHTCSSATTPGPNLILLRGRRRPPHPPRRPAVPRQSTPRSATPSNFEPNVNVLILLTRRGGLRKLSVDDRTDPRLRGGDRDELVRAQLQPVGCLRGVRNAQFDIDRGHQ